MYYVLLAAKEFGVRASAVWGLVTAAAGSSSRFNFDFYVSAAIRVRAVFALLRLRR